MPRNKEKPDYILLISAGLIILFGFIIFTSVSMARMANLAEEGKNLNLFHFLIRQFMTGVLPGLLIAYLVYKLPIKVIKKATPYLLGINLLAVALIFVPGLGLELRGSRRWLKLGPLSIQPTEFLKLSFILYLASWLSNRYNVKEDKSIFSETFIAFLAVCGLVGGLIIAQPDLSTLTVIIATGFVMYFTYRTPISHILTLVLGGGATFALLIFTAPYRLQRVKDLINTSVNLENLPYQAHQALIAIGSGGLLGLGFGMGNQKHGFLPFAISDSIFAAYAEEAGFVGSILLIVLFLIFSWRGLKIAKKKKDFFLSLAAVGISFWIFFQAFVHIGAMVGVLPITGIPLPFISYGRTHFISELAGLGLLLNISKS